MAIRVFIADDHPVVTEGLRFAIARKAPDIDVVGEARNGFELLEMSRSCPADVYIVDITMPDMNGIDATRRLLKDHPSAHVIMLSFHDSRAFVVKAFKNGASGYLLKDSATEDVVEAVREVFSGGRFLSKGVEAYGLPADSESGGDADGEERAEPTQRERQILQLIAEGHSGRDIAEKLGLSANTVRVHRANLMDKLKVHKGTDLVRYAIREGIAKL